MGRSFFASFLAEKKEESGQGIKALPVKVAVLCLAKVPKRSLASKRTQPFPRTACHAPGAQGRKHPHKHFRKPNA